MQQHREAADQPLVGLPNVTCVVLNWNGWQDTIPCVASLLEQNYEALKILIVDNHSTDDSEEQIARALPHVELMGADSNCGFAAGCNLGMRRALASGADFVWLLNNDTFAPPDTLAKLLQKASWSPTAGIIGSVLTYYEKPEQIQVWGGGTVRCHSGYTRHFGKPTALGKEAFLTFGSVLIRREVLLSVGLLDEGFFLYYEDSDFCFRARGRGWTLAVAEDTAILHKVGRTTKKRRKAFADRTVTASGLRFLSRHGRPRLLSRLVFLALRLGQRLVVLDFTGMRAVLDGVTDWRQQATQSVID